MAKIEIPPFVKNMGSKLIAYILNISKENAGKLLNSDFELPQEKEKILCQFVEICREVRAKHIDNTNIDLHMLHDLFRQFIKGEHIFNSLHEQAGGEKATSLECDDKVLQNLNKVFNKLYPLFLVNTTGWQQHFDVVLGDIGRASRDLPEGKHLYEEIKKDTVISSIVKQKSEQIGTHGYYKSSTGHGGSIQLISLPEMFLLNSFRLMRMREAFSLEAFSEAAEYTVNTFRRCTTGEAVEVPMFLGFSNISIDDIGDIKTDWGVIRPVGEGISELVPRHSSITRISGKQYRLGFVLESTYPYKVNFTDEDEDRKSPKEINDAAKRINEINENISFCFSLACDRNPPVSMSLAWTMVFDPINHGTQVTSNSIRRSPMPFYLVRDTKESNALIEWSKRIKKTDDKNIQLAIKRILSAINERTNPIDSFIDTVIAWENLFGANAELGFRISVSIAKLLGETETQIKEIQKKVNDYYNKRSKIVHGVNEVTNEEAINFREECLDITLKVIRKLYTEKVELISLNKSAERSKELAIV